MRAQVDEKALRIHGNGEETFEGFAEADRVGEIVDLVHD